MGLHTVRDVYDAVKEHLSTKKRIIARDGTGSVLLVGWSTHLSGKYEDISYKFRFLVSLAIFGGLWTCALVTGTLCVAIHLYEYELWEEILLC